MNLIFKKSSILPVGWLISLMRILKVLTICSQTKKKTPRRTIIPKNPLKITGLKLSLALMQLLNKFNQMTKTYWNILSKSRLAKLKMDLIFQSLSILVKTNGLQTKPLGKNSKFKVIKSKKVLVTPLIGNKAKISQWRLWRRKIKRRKLQ